MKQARAERCCQEPSLAQAEHCALTISGPGENDRGNALAERAGPSRHPLQQHQPSTSDNLLKRRREANREKRITKGGDNMRMGESIDNIGLVDGNDRTDNFTRPKAASILHVFAP
eukprot:7716766-Pyramimonas_sp.AAC.1